MITNLNFQERDSYKGVLDSYEKELTFTSSQLEKDQSAAHEKIIENYRDMVDRLEAQMMAAGAGSAGAAGGGGDAGKVEELSKSLAAVEQERDGLLEEINRLRAGGQGQAEGDTKILHFRYAFFTYDSVCSVARQSACREIFF